MTKVPLEERTRSRPSASIRHVSVIAPMWNESRHIEGVVEDIARQDFNGELEWLVADGGSTDGSADKLRAAAARAGIRLTVLENPFRLVSHALNLCIDEARGDLIVRIDCHSRYPADYVSRCVAAAEATGADNVGGVFVAKGRTPTERAVACAMDSPFGGIHWTRHRGGDRVEVDTVPYGAFRPDAFVRAGVFDETLVRDEDDEFNLRLRRAGGRIVLDPAIRVFYTPRGTFRGVCSQYYQYGFWKVPVMRKHGRVLSARSLAPATFVGSLALLAAAAPLSRSASRMLAAEVAVYSAAALGFGAVAVRGRKEPWRLAPRVAAVFPAFHISYGLGMLTGWSRGALRLYESGDGGPPKTGRVRRVLR